MTEKVFYSADGFIVTNKKISVNGDVYFTNKIGSCKIRNTIEIDGDTKFSQNAVIIIGVAAIFGSIYIMARED